MKPAERIAGMTRLFLDTAPVIYFVEKNPAYYSRVQPIFQAIDTGPLTAVTSAVTLSECLVHPYRLNLTPVAEAFTQLITAGANTSFVALDREVAQMAAELRARHNLTLADAFQAAAALTARCSAFLTNDPIFRRVPGLDVILVDELESEPT